VIVCVCERESGRTRYVLDHVTTSKETSKEIDTESEDRQIGNISLYLSLKAIERQVKREGIYRQSEREQTDREYIALRDK